MQDLNDFITGDTLTASQFVEIPTEIQNVIEGLGLTLSSGDLNQLGKAIAGYVANGNFYTDSGIANAYVLNKIGLKQTAPAYADGFFASFIAGNPNTGAATINVAGLGVKNIVLPGGSSLAVGDLAGRVNVAFDNAGDRFELLNAKVTRSVVALPLAKAVANLTAVENQIVQITDRGDAQFTYLSGQTPNTFNIVAADATGLDLVLRVGTRLDVAHMGAKTSGDSGPAHNATAALCISTGATLTSRPELFYSTDETVDFRSVRSVDYKSQLTGTGNFITLLLGGDSTVVQQFYTQRVFKINRGGASAAVRIVGGQRSTFHIGEASIIEMFADTTIALGGTDASMFYCHVWVQSCSSFVITNNAGTDGSVIQPVNENQIHLQFCIDLTIVDNGYKHNSNQFWGGNFEAAASFINMQTGIGNTMRNVRGEDTLAITFGANAANNTIITDWISFENSPVAGASVTNNGLNNCVKNLNDLTNDRVTIMSCNGTSLKDDGGGNSNLLGMNASLTKSVANNTITATANQQIFLSQLIEVNPSDEYFDVEVVPKLSGGIKMNVVGWDSNMVSIASTGDDVFFQGATNEDAGFGENSTTVTNKADQRRIHIKNTNAKYIQFNISASSSGCSFRRFTVEAVTSNKFGKKQMLASSIMPNI